ncbi:MAG: hypothetical protein KGN36_05560 [Acidobacteriota bacterium]|nr:hypothetical protein [Acidobacteriota bacterium]
MTRQPSCDRRTFVTRIATGALAASAASRAAEDASLPTIDLGKHKVTRLVAGYNPIGGYAHSVPKLSALMKDWFTPARTVEFVRRCEAAGINTWQADPDPKIFGALRAAWEGGSKIQWICLTRDLDAAQWKEILALHPIAIVHHGEYTDRAFRAGEEGRVRDFVHKVHDAGVLAGISSHSPQNISRVEDSGWEQDFYMTCFHNLRRDPDAVRKELGDTPLDELYLAGDPARMTAVVRQVSKPCLGFKILAAGRMCGNRGSIEKAFEFAFANIKKTDGVIVGMFPILTDEIGEDAAIARKYA